MDSNFEKELNLIFSNMIDICQEYVKNQADKIYIHCYLEDNLIFSNFFYKINNNIIDRSKINDCLSNKKRCDTSHENQERVLNYINEEIIEIENLFKSINDKVPAAIKLEFKEKSSEIKSKFLYDIHFTQNSDKDISELFDEWYKEEK